MWCKAVFRLVLCALPLVAFADDTRIRFEDVTRSAGVTFMHQSPVFSPRFRNLMPWLTAGGAAVAVGDYNNDGLDDIYFVNSRIGSKNQLYRNEGGFRFVEVAAAAGVDLVNQSEDTGVSGFALWFDYDGDGWQDLLVLRFGMPALFHNNRDGTFTDVAARAGLNRYMNAFAAVAFDYDHDGKLDLYIAGFFPEKNFFHPSDTKVLMESWETARNGGRNVLYRNNGDGTFTDVTEQAGVQDTGWANAVGVGDINNDGWDDIYIANDFGADVLFKNLGNGKFQNISKTAIGVDTKKGMNAEFGDYNNDGLLDIYVTNMTEAYLQECNMLWRNNGNETFTDVSQETGVCDTGWGWGAKFLDADNDGDLDIYVANGFVSAGPGDYMDVLLDYVFREDVDISDTRGWPDMQGRSMAGHEHNVLFEQTPTGFRSVGKSAGVDSIKDSRGVAIGDFDQDGRMDMVVGNTNAAPEIYRNITENGNRWLEIRLQGSGARSNRDAIGAKVSVRAGGRHHLREVSSGNGFMADNSRIVHFGLSSAMRADRLSVTWPNGAVQGFDNVETNKLYQLTQGGALLSVDWKKRALSNMEVPK